MGLRYLTLAVDYNRSRTGLIEPGGKLLVIPLPVHYPWQVNHHWALLDVDSYDRYVKQGSRELTAFKNWYIIPA